MAFKDLPIRPKLTVIILMTTVAAFYFALPVH